MKQDLNQSSLFLLQLISKGNIINLEDITDKVNLASLYLPRYEGKVLVPEILSMPLDTDPYIDDANRAQPGPPSYVPSMPHFPVPPAGPPSSSGRKYEPPTGPPGSKQNSGPPGSPAKQTNGVRAPVAVLETGGNDDIGKKFIYSFPLYTFFYLVLMCLHKLIKL